MRPGLVPAGWAQDDAEAALACYLRSAGTCGMPLPGRRPARDFFEQVFDWSEVPAPHFTGYFEPVFDGALSPDARNRFPLLRLPADPAAVRRADIAAGLHDDLALVWLADPLDAFLLQVQGSGRIRLADGGTLRIGFAGRNGQPYTSIGQCLVMDGEIAAAAISVAAIRAWAAAHPERLDDLLARNLSVVFFRPLDLPDDSAPLGALGVPVTALRSLAVDPDHIPLGAPVWVNVDGPDPIRGLMIAQDTGSAIRGPGRADIFCGTGAEAGVRAGALNHGGRMAVLRPRGR